MEKKPKLSKIKKELLEIKKLEEKLEKKVEKNIEKTGKPQKKKAEKITTKKKITKKEEKENPLPLKTPQKRTKKKEIKLIEEEAEVGTGIEKVEKKEKKGKKWWKKRSFGLLFLLSIVFVILITQLYLFIRYEYSGVVEYRGSCFIRSFYDGTGINSIQVFQVIPSDIKSSSLPILPISQTQFEQLGGDTNLHSTHQLCSGDIVLFYSPRSQKVSSLELQ